MSHALKNQLSSEHHILDSIVSLSYINIILCKNTWLKAQLQGHYLALYGSLLDIRKQKKLTTQCHIIYVVFWIMNELET